MLRVVWMNLPLEAREPQRRMRQEIRGLSCPGVCLLIRDVLLDTTDGRDQCPFFFFFPLAGCQTCLAWAF